MVEDQIGKMETRRMDAITRREFIRISALAGTALGLSACGVQAALREGRLARVQERRLLMGSVATLTLVTDDDAKAAKAIEGAFATMQRLEGQLSRFRADSEISRLNRAGSLAEPSRSLRTIVERALALGKKTGGAFDITVEPLLAAYRRAAEIGNTVSPVKVTELLALVHSDGVKVSAKGIEFETSDMAITLDGIAKGYVIDRGADTLRSLGCSEVLVEVGGDMMGSSRPRDPWQVGIKFPRPRYGAEYLGVAELSQGALATSGDYMNAFTEDYGQHHIIDPRSGISPAELASTSVVAPTAMDADALSTAMMVMGAEAGLDLIERLPGVEALLVDKDMQIRRSSGFVLDDDGQQTHRQSKGH